jgi:hypothetical protein
MYKIERRSTGFLLTFGGTIDASEMQKWFEESTVALKSAPPEFGVIIDMRTLLPLTPEAQGTMVKGQQAYKAKGMKRSCVIVKDKVTSLQFKRLAMTSGIYSFERYLDATTWPNWTDTAVAWVRDGIDPDKGK